MFRATLFSMFCDKGVESLFDIRRFSPDLRPLLEEADEAAEFPEKIDLPISDVF